MFQDKMVTTATPERVYALCKIVEKEPLSISDLKDKMEPAFLLNKSEYFYDYRTAAEELGLITISDNIVSLAVDAEKIRTIESMRYYVNSLLENFAGGQFYQVTSEYFSLGSDVFIGEQNIAARATEFSQRLNRPVDAPAMRAWRFWAPFLGFGYLQNMFIIPNANVFLWDIINIAGITKNRRYSFGDFIDLLRPYSNIIIDSNSSTRQLNYGVSNGLRLLHDSGFIRLEHILDQEDIWNLYPLKAHAIPDTVTNITICK